MGLFSKKYEYPTSALNADCWGKTSFLFEVGDSFLTREEYTPENMKRVTAIMVGGSHQNYTYETRIDVADIAEIHLYPSFLEPSIHMASLFEFGQPFKVEIKTRDHQIYKFDLIGDSCSVDEVRSVGHDKNLSDAEMIEKLASISCMYALAIRF